MPNKQTFGFFNQNLVMKYGRPQALADGVNVNYDVYRIKTEVTEAGARVEAGDWLQVPARHTGSWSPVPSTRTSASPARTGANERGAGVQAGLGQDMLVTCLWSRRSASGEPDLLSFAAITDEPPPEVAAAGHDRCIVPIKPEHLEARPAPEPGNLKRFHEILDDRERPYYEHRMAA